MGERKSVYPGKSSDILGNIACETAYSCSYLHNFVLSGVSTIIKWQGKSERSDWFFLGRDFAIRTVSVETVISGVFFVFESRQTQNKHGASAI